MRATSKTTNTSRARSRSKDACRARNTASPPPAAARSKNISSTWRRSSRQSETDPSCPFCPSRPSCPTSEASGVSTVCVSDVDLVTRAQRGDSAAFGELVDRHRGAVYRAARAALGSQDEADEMMASLTATNPTPEQATAHDEMRRAIEQAIRALTPKLRDALLLVQAGEHTYDEIGAMLGTPTGTIKWRVSEARRFVRTKLRAAGFEHV